jgi:aminopeptidase 2
VKNGLGRGENCPGITIPIIYPSFTLPLLVRPNTCKLQMHQLPIRAFPRPLDAAKLRPICFGLTPSQVPHSVVRRLHVLRSPLSPVFSSSRHSTPRFVAVPFRSASKRYCSYRKMCRSRHAGGLSGSTNITHGREVLPTNVKPLHYDLTLEPDLEKFTYEGVVVIE